MNPGSWVSLSEEEDPDSYGETDRFQILTCIVRIRRTGNGYISSLFCRLEGHPENQWRAGN